MTGDALRPAVSMPERSVDRLRAICLSLPEAVEKETWGDPTFRVRDRIFALVRHGDGRLLSLNLSQNLSEKRQTFATALARNGAFIRKGNAGAAGVARCSCPIRPGYRT